MKICRAGLHQYEGAQCSQCQRLVKIAWKRRHAERLKRENAAWLKSNREYRVWSNMIARCTKPSWRNYELYGGRGITVCDRWLGANGYANFLADMGKRPSAAHSLERKDNNSGYSPKNCAWVTHDEQMRNTRRNIFLEFAGERLCLKDWAVKSGVHKSTLRWRIVVAGWPLHKALSPTISATR